MKNKLIFLTALLILGNSTLHAQSDFQVEGKNYISISYNQKSTIGLAPGNYYGGGMIVGITSDGENGLIILNNDFCGEEDIEATMENEGNPVCGEIDNSTAKKICKDLVVDGIDDWTLPNQNELKFIKDNLFKNGSGEFESLYYHSSNGGSNNVQFREKMDHLKIARTGVRCVRSF